MQEEEKKRSLIVRDNSCDHRQRDGPCGKKCFVVTAVALFLFLTFVALPAGAFLIIHGRHQDSLAFQLGGAAVVCVPILVGVILTIVFCARRHRRKATFTSVSTARV
ncbi:uncharacterized protein LOC101850025 [Aplysia californica]|uniref:Uncharacterized protein LOC101850025 n=1 Tax=Aplysia californica TaxID=6500 RepID=A0ABM1A5R3_APLCA|nr:uncharacterized protein LOC101850025 [Aplysia californica]